MDSRRRQRPLGEMSWEQNVQAISETSWGKTLKGWNVRNSVSVVVLAAYYTFCISFCLWCTSITWWFFASHDLQVDSSSITNVVEQLMLGVSVVLSWSEVENECISHNCSLCAVFLPKFSKFVKIWQSSDKTVLHSFFETQCTGWPQKSNLCTLSYLH